MHAFQVPLVPLCFNFIDIKDTNGSATLTGIEVLLEEPEGTESEDCEEQRVLQ